MDLMSTAQILGNFGEFIASIAVLLTLIYLTVQIRQNTHALQRTEMREVIGQFDRWRTAVQNPDNANLWLRGLRGELSDDGERFIFNQLLVQHIFAMHSMWDSDKRGILNPGEWSRNAPILAEMLQTPGGVRFWKVMRTQQDAEFVQAIESNFA